MSRQPDAGDDNEPTACEHVKVAEKRTVAAADQRLPDQRSERREVGSTPANAAAPALESFFENVGRWHLPIFLFGFLRGTPTIISMMYVVFAAPTHQEFWCADAGRDPSLPVCDGTCNSFEFDRTIYGYTIIEHYGLVCQRSWIASLAQSLYLWGLTVGGVLHAHVSDWYGRRTCVAVSLGCTLVVAPLAALAPTAATFAVARMATACALVGFAEAAFTFVVETVDSGKRYMPTLVIGMGWSSGMLLLPLVAWWLRNWQLLQMAVVLSVLPLVAVWWVIPESPRWQLSVGRFDAAEANLKKLVQQQNIKYGEADVVAMVNARRLQHQPANSTQKPSLVTVLRGPYTVKTFVFGYCLWISSMMWYYLTVSSATISGSSPYIGYALSGLAEFPTKLINTALIKWLPRKATLLGAFLCSSAALLSAGLMPKGYTWTRLALIILGKTFVSAIMSVGRVTISESYPTVVRALALSVTVMISRVGTCIVPFFDDLERVSGLPILPIGLIAAMCLVAALLTRLLDETHKQELPDQLRLSSPARGSPSTDPVQRR